jgi:hypothetical protein
MSRGMRLGQTEETAAFKLFDVAPAKKAFF